MNELNLFLIERAEKLVLESLEYFRTARGHDGWSCLEILNLLKDHNVLSLRDKIVNVP